MAGPTTVKVDLVNPTYFNEILSSQFDHLILIDNFLFFGYLNNLTE
jgi:hypothetical protein